MCSQHRDRADWLSKFGFPLLEAHSLGLRNILDGENSVLAKQEEGLLEALGHHADPSQWSRCLMWCWARGKRSSQATWRFMGESLDRGRWSRTPGVNSVTLKCPRGCMRVYSVL